MSPDRTRVVISVAPDHRSGGYAWTMRYAAGDGSPPVAVEGVLPDGGQAGRKAALKAAFAEAERRMREAGVSPERRSA